MLDDDSVVDAIVHIYAPKPPQDDEYFQKTWSKPLFKALLSVDIDTDENILKIRIESISNGSIIAIAPYDGTHGIEPVADSTSHYVLTISKNHFYANIGVKFIDRSDSIDFSLVTQKFSRKKMADERESSPQWSNRRLAKPSSGYGDGKEEFSRVSDSPVPLLQPPPTTKIEVSEVSNGDDSDSDFGEFQ